MFPSIKTSAPPSASNRQFGLLFALVFTSIGIYGFYRSWSNGLGTAAIAVALFFLACALLAPRFLAPLNKAWFLLGLWMGEIISPIVLGAIFFLIVTPVSLATRAFGRDALRLRKEGNVRSYWIHRDPPGPDGDSFKNQF